MKTPGFSTSVNGDAPTRPIRGVSTTSREVMMHPKRNEKSHVNSAFTGFRLVLALDSIVDLAGQLLEPIRRST